MSDHDSEERLPFEILGEDNTTDLDKLEKYTGEVAWKDLEKHYQAGTLLYVDPSLEIVEVGKAICGDDTASVAQWKQNGDLVTPSTPHAFFWEESKARFIALVVSPFVLIQPVPETAPT